MIGLFESIIQLYSWAYSHSKYPKILQCTWSRTDCRIKPNLNSSPIEIHSINFIESVYKIITSKKFQKGVHKS